MDPSAPAAGSDQSKSADPSSDCKLPNSPCSHPPEGEPVIMENIIKEEVAQQDKSHIYESMKYKPIGEGPYVAQ